MEKKKKKSMMEILRSTDSLADPPLPQANSQIGVRSRNLCKSQSSSNGAGSCSRVSWADEVESPRSPMSHLFSIDSMKKTSSDSSILISDKNTVPLKPVEFTVEEVCTELKDNSSPSVPLKESSGIPISINANDKQDLAPAGNVSRSWSSLFADNRKPGRGLDLSYVPPETKDIVMFGNDEWNEGISSWQFSLIGQVLGLTVKFKAMETFVQKTWSHLNAPEVCLLKAGIFLFKFKSKDEMCEILENGPWFFGSRHFLLKPWSIDEGIDKIKDCIYPMWIQLPGLRLNLWNANAISKIVSVVGRPITTDKLTANKQMLAYARVLVEVTFPSSLPDQISIQGPNGKQFSQKVNYELKPRWCEFCNQVGHESSYCKRKSRTERWVPKAAVPVNLNQKVVVQNSKNNEEFRPASGAHGNKISEISSYAGQDRIPVFDGENVGISNDNLSQEPGQHIIHIQESDPEINPSKGKGILQDESGNNKDNVELRTVHVVHVSGSNVDHVSSDTAKNPWSFVQGNGSKKAVPHLSFLALLETKVKGSNLSITAKKIEKNWQWLSNVGNTGKARILVMWDPCILDVQVVKFSEQHISCSVKSVDGKFDCFISSIYGFNHLEARQDLWLDLCHLHQNLGNYPWLLCGDFNTMINNEEKLGGVALTTVDTSDFNSFIEDCQLSHLKTLGCFYTWSNKQPGLSDHSPAFVSIYDDCVQGKKPFKFFKMWTKHPSFIPIVSKTWQSSVEGYKMYSVSTKLKLLKSNLKELNKKHFYNISEQVQRARVALEEVQRNLHADPFNSSLMIQEKDFLSSYKRLLDCELSFYQQKARIA
ncbi:uncharacterized protein LOC109821354 [Asparagus officinalis]|uniref:uncharacterized protein LOC109821354 n=1 Tax=Asparagus officinalis TaxID=4686 RepID=UPI00098E13B3|nr:uncharacterized protein LOC109821354 [Asparagus officinalis]